MVLIQPRSERRATGHRGVVRGWRIVYFRKKARHCMIDFVASDRALRGAICSTTATAEDSSAPITFAFSHQWQARSFGSQHLSPSARSFEAFDTPADLSNRHVM